MSQRQATWLTLTVLLLAVGVYWLVRQQSAPLPPPPIAAKVGSDLPDPTLTPGDVLTRDVQTICQPGYTKTARNVPQALKQQVYRRYGILKRQPGQYEIDHLIALELGGSNSIRNLWPQSYLSQPYNARLKDALENKLHDLVCAGRVPLPEAQQAIAKNWLAAYQKYIGPLPTR